MRLHHISLSHSSPILIGRRQYTTTNRTRRVSDAVGGQLNKTLGLRQRIPDDDGDPGMSYKGVCRDRVISSMLLFLDFAEAHLGWSESESKTQAWVESIERIDGGGDFAGSYVFIKLPPTEFMARRFVVLYFASTEGATWSTMLNEVEDAGQTELHGALTKLKLKLDVVDDDVVPDEWVVETGALKEMVAGANEEAMASYRHDGRLGEQVASLQKLLGLHAKTVGEAEGVTSTTVTCITGVIGRLICHGARAHRGSHMHVGNPNKRGRGDNNEDSGEDYSEDNSKDRKNFRCLPGSNILHGCGKERLMFYLSMLGGGSLMLPVAIAKDDMPCWELETWMRSHEIAFAEFLGSRGERWGEFVSTGASGVARTDVKVFVKPVKPVKRRTVARLRRPFHIVPECQVSGCGAALGSGGSKRNHWRALEGLLTTCNACVSRGKKALEVNSVYATEHLSVNYLQQTMAKALADEELAAAELVNECQVSGCAAALGPGGSKRHHWRALEGLLTTCAACAYRGRVALKVSSVRATGALSVAYLERTMAEALAAEALAAAELAAAELADAELPNECQVSGCGAALGSGGSRRHHWRALEGSLTTCAACAYRGKRALEVSSVRATEHLSVNYLERTMAEALAAVEFFSTPVPRVAWWLSRSAALRTRAPCPSITWPKGVGAS